MEITDLVLVEKICAHHELDFSFFKTLEEFGLIEIHVIEEKQYLPIVYLKELEKIIYFHFELNINLEGIDTIYNLLKQIEVLQLELISVKNKLSLIEH